MAMDYQKAKDRHALTRERMRRSGYASGGDTSQDSSLLSEMFANGVGDSNHGQNEDAIWNRLSDADPSAGSGRKGRAGDTEEQAGGPPIKTGRIVPPIIVGSGRTPAWSDDSLPGAGYRTKPDRSGGKPEKDKSKRGGKAHAG